MEIWEFMQKQSLPYEAKLVHAKLRAQEFYDKLPIKNANGQVKRVARRFALLASAGELATKMEILPWPQGEAFLGIKKCMFRRRD